MKAFTQILHLEDDPADAELVQARLDDAGLSFGITLARTREEFETALYKGGMDIILSDYSLPMFDGMTALKLAQEECPEAPFIFISGAMGEETAIEALTRGATDYVLKHNLTRLPSAVERALEEASNQHKRKQAETELKRLNRELELRVNERTTELAAANARLLELDRLKSMFIASMSHELRTPLNSIIGFSSILLNEWAGPLSDEQKENISVVLGSGKHLLSLINDVIEVSKIESGKVDAHIGKFDIRDAVLEAVKTFEKDLEKKNLQLIVQVPSKVLHSDRRRILQCLLNLLSNATKFTDQGSINIYTGPPTKGSMLTITVEDTGIGISEEDLGRLFKPFVRLQKSGVSDIPGTGLGLYLTKKLLNEVLKGDILVTSSGVGSRFTMSLPMEL